MEAESNPCQSHLRNIEIEHKLACKLADETRKSSKPIVREFTKGNESDYEF